MLNLQSIVDQIRDDAPCVYDILHEQCMPYPVGGYPHSDSQYTWGDYFECNIELKSTPDRLLNALKEYNGDNWDVHYWSGRYAQMIEQDQKNNTPIRVPLTELDCHDLLSGQTFHWSFSGVNLFLFNTEENPEFDPDRDEYDPSVSIF